MTNDMLGVYDCKDTMLLESGAYNHRHGRDALAERAEHAMEYGAPQVLRNDSMASRVERVAGEQMGAFQVKVAHARPENAYICNETHFRALKAQTLAAAARSSGIRLRAAYFLHLPYAREDDHVELADGVAALIKRLVELELAE